MTKVLRSLHQRDPDVSTQESNRANTQSESRARSSVRIKKKKKRRIAREEYNEKHRRTAGFSNQRDGAWRRRDLLSAIRGTYAVFSSLGAPRWSSVEERDCLIPPRYYENGAGGNSTLDMRILFADGRVEGEAAGSGGAPRCLPRSREVVPMIVTGSCQVFVDAGVTEENGDGAREGEREGERESKVRGRARWRQRAYSWGKSSKVANGGKTGGTRRKTNTEVTGATPPAPCPPALVTPPDRRP